MTEQPTTADFDIGERITAAARVWRGVVPSPLAGGFDRLEANLRALQRGWDRAPATPAATAADGETPTRLTASNAASAAVAHADVFAGNAQWQSEWLEMRKGYAAYRETWQEISRHMGPRIGEKLASDDSWKALWHTVAQRSWDTYSRQAAALADRLERGTPEPDQKVSAAVSALRDASAAAGGYSAQLAATAPGPAAVSQATEARRTTPQARMGYGPREGAAVTGSEAVKARHDAWEGSLLVQAKAVAFFGNGLGQTVLSGNGKLSRSFKAAFQDLPAGRLEQPREATGQFGAFALAAYQLKAEVEQRNRRAGRTVYADEHIRDLDVLAREAYKHAQRLSRTLPPGSDPTASAYIRAGDAVKADREAREVLSQWRRTAMYSTLRSDAEQTGGRTSRRTAASDLVGALKGLGRSPDYTGAYDEWSKAADFGKAADAARTYAELVARTSRGKVPEAEAAALVKFAGLADAHASRLAKAAPPKSVLPDKPSPASRGAAGARQTATAPVQASPATALPAQRRARGASAAR